MSDNNESKENPVEIAPGAAEAATPETVMPEDTARTPMPTGESGAGDLAAPAAPTPEESLASMEAEKAELRERMLRIAADFDNWKKRARKDQGDAEARARETVLRDFLEIADNLERAMASFAEGKQVDVSSVREGVELVLRQFRAKLERYQVKSIEAVGQAFDPRYHEAIAQAPTADVKPGSILHELQKGYLVGEKLLRPAMVVVAAAPPAPASAKPASDEDPTPPPKAPGNEGED